MATAEQNIDAAVLASPLVRFNWPGRRPGEGPRGRAPIGYLKGMARLYARELAKLNARDPVALEMAKPPGSDPDRDALTRLRASLSAAGIVVGNGGRDTLRALFVVMLGLGMRESSGKYWEGRDITAKIPASPETVEAGLFQTSWDIHEQVRAAAPLIIKLFDQWRNAADPMLAVFKEGLGDHSSPDFGSGDGQRFQHITKKCPTFAVEVAGVGLRNTSRHWGPIARDEIDISLEADRLLRSIEREKLPATAPVTAGDKAAGPLLGTGFGATVGGIIHWLGANPVVTILVAVALGAIAWLIVSKIMAGVASTPSNTGGGSGNG